MGEGLEVEPLSEREFTQASMALKALSHPLRLKILCWLGGQGQEASALEIMVAIGASQSNVSQHLSILRSKGIIAARKDGNRVMYRISDQRMLTLFHKMRELFCDA